jgi:hypothetical protein
LISFFMMQPMYRVEWLAWDSRHLLRLGSHEATPAPSVLGSHGPWLPG